MTTKRKQIRIAAIVAVAAAVLFLVVQIVITETRGDNEQYALAKTDIDTESAVVLMRDGGVWEMRYGEYMPYQTVYVYGKSRDAGTPMLVYMLHNGNSSEGWQIGATARADGEPLVELEIEEPNPFRLDSFYQETRDMLIGYEGIRNNWHMRRTYVCYGENAIAPIELDAAQLPENAAIQIQQDGNRFWIHIRYFEAEKKAKWPDVYGMLVQNGCIASET